MFLRGEDDLMHGLVGSEDQQLQLLVREGRQIQGSLRVGWLE